MIILKYVLLSTPMLGIDQKYFLEELSGRMYCKMSAFFQFKIYLAAKSKTDYVKLLHGLFFFLCHLFLRFFLYYGIIHIQSHEQHCHY